MILQRVFASLVMLALTATACKGDEAKSNAQKSEVSPSAHKHDVPGETCFIEDPSKRDADRLWCKEHDRYEDRCWECHPELRDAKRPYCEEHGMYEDECFLCDPARAVEATKAPGELTGHQKNEVGEKKDELYCNEHQLPEHECGICQPELAGKLPVGESLSVRLASARSVELAGLKIAKPVQGEAATSIQLLGEIQFDGNRLARVTPLASGVLAKINVDVGQLVEAGQVLAVVNAPSAAEAKADYLTVMAGSKKWQAASKRQRQLFDEKVGSTRAMEEAEASFQQAKVATRLARQRLLNLGFRDSEVRSIRDSRSAMFLRAPFAGSVVNRSAVLGEAVDTSKALFEIADLSQMWVDLSVPGEHAAQLRVGTKIEVSASSLPGGPKTGQITWVSPVADERTRMVKARGIVPNTEGAMRHGTFADVTATIDTHSGVVRLPASAVHQIDNLPFVFVQTDPDLFAARRVALGDRLPSDEFVILGGITPDDAVVMSGGFTIKSALLASRLGAGCTDD